MKFTFDHNNINLLDLDKGLFFYRKALGLEKVKRFEPENKDSYLFILEMVQQGTE